jgi:methylglyoxal synthase
VGAFDFNDVQLFVLNQHKLALCDLVATGFVGAVYRFTGLLINQLLAQPVAGVAVDLAKRNPFRR